MPPPLSAGILLFRVAGEPEVLLVKPGGPFWRGKDAGAWMIPKGMVEPGETPEQAALREFEEEVGTRLQTVPERLCTVRQAGGKVVEAFAVEGDFDPATLCSNAFEMEWPPRSGQRQAFPEVAEARWMPLEQARELMLPSQLPMLDALEERLSR
ncbi:NUDIX domain-containing protein [uncultured Sphingomonas sp.]|uniref:NUDIX domain-containing protein n=1 Tax=uncultured Sphingomonas sp. TaxID=158754 RepID=UPI0025CE39EB|nr:NUDIX domain-containing protein [uncultured Sphingomonas sp.]